MKVWISRYATTTNSREFLTFWCGYGILMTWHCEGRVEGEETDYEYGRRNC